MSPITVATILVACLCLAYAAPLEDQVVNAPETKAELNYRLPLTVKPINYKVSLKPYLNESDPKAFTFDGECYIEIQADKATSQIQLHMKNLKISVSEYYKKDAPTVKTSLPAATPDSMTDIVVYNLGQDLQANVSYVLHYVYTGSMDDDMHGFYRSSYKTSQNVTKWLGSTQFERTHARRVFPSFDEPKFKATFHLSLTRHRSLKSYGSTRILQVIPEGEYVTDVYAVSPKMSTYVLAFIVSEFNDRYDGEFGVIARPEYYAQTEYAYDVGKDLLSAMDNYFGLPYYSLGDDKMHLAAIPDFSAGAMENWGLLTFRERAVLYDAEHSTLSSKQYIAAVIAHEQAHMWFGDLVTCDWWSYTWLNEGFARYFQYFATDMVESYLQMDPQFVVDQIQSVMGMDATNATNPMSDEDAKTTAELGRMFNSISYNKGATVIRMTKYILGEENFKKSLNEYLTAHQYKNTVPSDLFTIWKKYWPVKFATYADLYFSSFTTQVGYPVVTFNRTDDTTVHVSQVRFLLKDQETADPKLQYTVPITYTTSKEKNFNNTDPKFFLQQQTESFTVDKDVSWIIANIREIGYYRVNYDEKTWHQIHSKLLSANWDGIHELNRAQIVDDLLNLARAGVIDYKLAFAVLEYLSTETNYLAWTAAFNGFSYLTIRLGTDTQDFARYIRQITSKAYNMLGFEEKSTDSTLDIYNRAKILAWSCKYGNSDCISKAKSYFNANLKAEPVPVNIRSVVYCVGVREGKEQEFNKLYNKYKTETVATEETLLLNSLGCVREKSLVTRFFNMIISDEVRRQDKSAAMSSLIAENNENVDVVFDLVIEKTDALAESMGGYDDVASVISNLAGRFTTEAQLNKLKEYNEKNKSKFGSSYDTLKSAEKTAAFNLEWSKQRMGPLKSFFQQYGTNSAAMSSVSVFSLVFVALIAFIFH